jgi:hypothetical protein
MGSEVGGIDSFRCGAWRNQRAAAQVDLYNFVNMNITITRMKSTLSKDVINAI